MGVVKLSTAGILNFQKYSSMRAGIPLPPPKGYDLLESQILSSSAASVTFSGLDAYAADYKHLQIRAVTRSTSTRTDGGGQLFTRINNDTGNSYSSHNMWGNGSSVLSSGATNANSIWTGWTAGNSAAANSFGLFVIDVLDPFASSKNRVIRGISGISGYSEVQIFSGMRINTEAVTSITIGERLGFNLAQFSRFSLYGLGKK